ncbi:hypothetical protein GGF31_001865 [Allomyces arbusculus]|nr:hypothetical protein GGF31_001865 [Allomyces arbusculus]
MQDHHHHRARRLADDPAATGPPAPHHGTPQPTSSRAHYPGDPHQQHQQRPHRMPPGPHSRERDPAARTPWWAAAAPPCDELDVYWPAGMHPAFEAALATAPSANSNPTATTAAPAASTPQSGEPPAHAHPHAHAPTATHPLPPPALPQAPHHPHVARPPHQAPDRRRWPGPPSDVGTHHSHRHHHHAAGSGWTAANATLPPPPGPPSTRYDHRYPHPAHANFPPLPPPPTSTNWPDHQPPAYPQWTPATDTYDEYSRVPPAHHPHHHHRHHLHASWWPPATPASAPPTAPPSAWDHAQGWYSTDEPSAQLQPARKRARAAHGDENDEGPADPRAAGAAEVAVSAAATAKRARQDARPELGVLVLPMPAATTVAAATAQVEAARGTAPAPFPGPADEDEGDDDVDEENVAEADGEGGVASKSRRSYHVFTRKTYELMVATLLIANRHAPAASGTSAVDRAVSALVTAKHPAVYSETPLPTMAQAEWLLNDPTTPAAHQVAGMTRKKWNRLKSNLQLHVARGQYRCLSWVKCARVIVPQEDWPLVIRAVHVAANAKSGDIEHRSLKQTYLALKNTHQARRSRCGISYEDCEQYCQGCVCYGALDSRFFQHLQAETNAAADRDGAAGADATGGAESAVDHAGNQAAATMDRVGA